MGLAGLRLPCGALAASLSIAAIGCYSGAPATRDVNAAWRGRSRHAIEARWGRAASVSADTGGGTLLRWSHTHHHIELPSGHASLHVEPGLVEGEAEVRPGAIWNSQTTVVAHVDGAGVIAAVEGPSLRWGPPDDANLRWGTILGMHVGMGRLDDTLTPLPSGGLYLGGMLSPTLGLVGCFSLVSGSDNAGGAMAFAWGMAAQWWPATRLWLRAGPAMVLDFDPGFEDATLSPGLTTGASYAVIKVGTFVLDLRLDLIASPSAVFGSAGIGVNMN